MFLKQSTMRYRSTSPLRGGWNYLRPCCQVWRTNFAVSDSLLYDFLYYSMSFFALFTVVKKYDRLTDNGEERETTQLQDSRSCDFLIYKMSKCNHLRFLYGRQPVGGKGGKHIYFAGGLARLMSPTSTFVLLVPLLPPETVLNPSH